MAKQLSLSDEQIDQLRRSGAPLVVSIGEGGDLVVQDAEAYRRMIALIDELDLAESGAACAERWLEMQDAKDSGVPLEEFIADIRGRLRRTG